MKQRDRELYDGLSDLLRAPAPPPSPDIFEGDENLTAAAIAVYRNNVRSSLSKALREKFPVIHALVGDKFFKFAANEYFNLAPPSSPLLSDYGATFPEFLDEFEPAQNLPYLGDMARLEIAWLEAYRAEDAAPLSADAAMDAAGEDPSALCFIMHPSLRLRQSRYAVGSIWRRHQKEGQGARVSAGNGEYVMIVRPYGEVQLEIISVGAFAALENLSAGDAVGAAFEDAMTKDAAFDPQAMFKLLFESGVVAGIRNQKGE